MSSKPTMPGRLGSPRPRRASRLSRISALTGRYVAPEARSSPRVVGRGRELVRRCPSATTSTVRRRRHPLTGGWRMPAIGPSATPTCQDRRRGRVRRPYPASPGRTSRRRPHCWTGSSGARRGALPRAGRAGRRPGLAQVREPAAHRLVQDPRRLHADRPARPTRSGPAASSPPAPATTRRGSRWPRSCSGSRPRSSCPRARRCRRCRRPAAYGADVRFHGSR